MENNAASNQPPGNLIEMAGRGMQGIRPGVGKPGVALGDQHRGNTPYTFEETGLPTGPGPMPPPAANGTTPQPIYVMAPGPFDGIMSFLATPGPLGIPYGGYLAVAAAIGVIVYMNLPASGKKK